MSDTNQRKFADLGPLHDLMIRACPPAEGEQSIPLLATAIGLSAQGLYNAIKRNKVSPRLAAQIVQVSGGRASLDDFSPYVFK